MAFDFEQLIINVVQGRSREILLTAWRTSYQNVKILSNGTPCKMKLVSDLAEI